MSEPGEELLMPRILSRRVSVMSPWMRLIERVLDLRRLSGERFSLRCAFRTGRG